MKSTTQMCACGEPLHYSNPATEQMVTEFSNRLGEYVDVTVDGFTYLVQRHYLALHGLNARHLPLLLLVEIVRMKP